MSMMWVKKQSKWIIVAGALVIGGSLILMDLPAANGMSATQAVGEVDGEEIPIAPFQQELQGYMSQQEAQTGRVPSAADFATAREELFRYRVQSLILGRITRDYGLRATPEEMRDWLLRNPRDVAYSLAQYEGYEAVPWFLRDSTLDMPRYQAWMSQDSVYDRPGMRMLEERLKAMVGPQLQLQEIFRAQVHRTDLEERFLLETREDKASLRYYHVPASAFAVDPASLSEAELKAHFEANPDSFWFPREAARLAYVRIPLQPSSADSALMREFAAELRGRIEAGEKFEDLARSYSSDPGSADSGGRLPPTPRDAWVPSFANAAFALAPGQLSEPVLSPFGYHLILMHGITREGGVEKASVSHIMLNITTGTETADSLVALADALKEKAREEGLKAAAAEAGLAVQETPAFPKGTPTPLGAYVQGVASFAFGALERKATISEPLQSDEGVYVLERLANYDAGRDFGRSRDAVVRSLARARALEAARAEAERVRPLIEAEDVPAQLGKAQLSITGMLVAESYAAGFGSGGALFQALRQKPGAWGPVIPTSEGAVIAQVTAVEPMPADEKSARVAAARNEGDNYQIGNLFQRWMETLPKLAKVKNNLDELYRE